MQSQVQRIGVFGGTFDPIHLGHLRAAKAACDRLKLDRLIWVPNRRSPLRLEENRTPAHHRVAMLESAVGDEPGFEVSDIEAEREGPSYLVETLEALRRGQPDAEWVFLMGADSLDTFDRWVRVEDIVSMVQVCVMPRPGGEAERKFTDLEVRAPELAKKVQLLEGPHTDISASEVRHRIQTGQPITDWVPTLVSEYISEHKLYV